MKLLKKIKNKLNYYSFIVQKSYKIIFRSKKTIFLFGSPFHSNMGDQAQTYCIYKWFSYNYPDYKIYTFRLTESFPILLKLVRNTIRKNDMLVFHSGYHLTDLYHEQDVYCEVVKLFPEYPIIIFPQTINYKDKNNLLKTANLFNQHKRILLMCRDEYSYNTAKQYFTGCKLLLYPDIVTSIIGTKEFQNQRDGILFCMRNDIEAFYSKEEINELKSRFNNIKIEETDTTLDIDVKKIYKERDIILNEIFQEYSKFKLIITDRYHGTIFSLIANTPVIVISSSDHKLSSGVKWFPKDFYPYVQYATNLNEAYQLANNIINNENLDYKLPAYFKNEYFDKLKEKIQEI